MLLIYAPGLLLTNSSALVLLLLKARRDLSLSFPLIIPFSCTNGIYPFKFGLLPLYVLRLQLPPELKRFNTGQQHNADSVSIVELPGELLLVV